jgi:uncharacterized protein YndB with AHSA1/START domain
MLPSIAGRRNPMVASDVTGDGSMERVERRIDLPVPPAELWPALTEPDRLSEWFGADSDLRPEPGARATFRWPDGRERGAVVEEVEAGRRLAFRWLAFERRPGGGVVLVGPGRVELEVTGSGEGSILTVTEWGTEQPAQPRAGAVTR